MRQHEGVLIVIAGLALMFVGRLGGGLYYTEPLFAGVLFGLGVVGILAGLVRFYGAN